MLWTFQDLKMLIGTDMPILGGGTHPCVSLRLHDLSEPINVLTGLDYWLDNLMSNVPEVLMCYHVDGVLKKYSLIKTEDLPHLPDSTFKPEVVHDVAENILSFLRANATKTGHTYWLFKGEDDDCVKLYDLSSLLESRFEEVNRDDNPFSGHVALLLYRIACNMLRKRHVVDYGDRLGTVRTILSKTLELIKGDKYLQVRANIHMMLADCYVPRDHRPLATEFAGAAAAAASALARSPERAGAAESPWTQQPMVRVDLLPIAGDALERTECAMEHVLAAFSCLRRRDELERDDKAPKMARPSQAIPMP
ncbi:erythroid differentiation-related factor 1-like [Pollicipes pollicipes]|nr:erythroid differentiation-related factor 1-like [Pollicipes pollicipes]